jgi:subtilisin family serine protease
MVLAPRAARRSLAALSLALVLPASIWAAPAVVRPSVPRLGISVAASRGAAASVAGARLTPALTLRGVARLGAPIPLGTKIPVLPVPAVKGAQITTPQNISVAQIPTETAEMLAAVNALPEGEARESLRAYITELQAAHLNPVAEISPVPAAADELPKNVRDGLAKMVRERLSAEKRVREIKAKGLALQTWGVPNSISMQVHKSLRYSKLYRMNGMPTGLGVALHDVMAPLVQADPAFLAKVTQPQLHEAVQELAESLKYRMGPEVYDGPVGLKKKVSGAPAEGYDYPEWRKAFMERATAILSRPAPQGEKRAGLGQREASERPAEVLMTVLLDVAKQIKALQPKLESGEAKMEEVKPLMDLALSLHAIMGLPVQTAPGEVGFIPVKHSQAVTVMGELRKRGVSERVMTSVLRAYPLGESLLRLGVTKLWEQGITGKGVKIAVLDNGIDFLHPDLMDTPNQVSENFTRDRGEHTKGGHGTPMASIIRAILPDAELHSYQIWSNTDLPGVRLTSEETEAATLKALDKIEASGIKLVNMSGGSAMDYSSSKVAQRVAELSKKGIIFVVSAGNEGDELPNGLQMRSPATSEGAISVHAVDYHGVEAPFSSSGRVFDPTKGTITDKYDIAAFGVNVKAAAQMPAQMYQMEPLPYEDGSGTSPAAPHVTGVVGAMFAAAQQAGIAVADATLLPTIRKALAEAAVNAGKLPVLKNAEKAVNAFLRLIKAATPTT